MIFLGFSANFILELEFTTVLSSSLEINAVIPNLVPVFLKENETTPLLLSSSLKNINHQYYTL
jgi:hypothetical protein